jgi:hypothetical protein
MKQIVAAILSALLNLPTNSNAQDGSLRDIITSVIWCVNYGSPQGAMTKYMKFEENGDLYLVIENEFLGKNVIKGRWTLNQVTLTIIEQNGSQSHHRLFVQGNHLSRRLRIGDSAFSVCTFP